jgi:hypothetical protein
MSVSVPQQDAYDIAYMVPQTQRAVEGVVQANQELSTGEMYQVTADACADIVLYCGSLFGSQLLVSAIDPTTLAPTGFATSQWCTPDQVAVITSQAALTYFYHRFAGTKMSETIADEASNWSYSLSPALLIAQLKLLQDRRDKALEAVESQHGGVEAYISFLGIRDLTVSRYIEPWVYGHPEGTGIGAGGMEGDPGYGALPTGGSMYSGG